jgi:hypothetical protein
MNDFWPQENEKRAWAYIIPCENFLCGLKKSHFLMLVVFFFSVFDSYSLSLFHKIFLLVYNNSSQLVKKSHLRYENIQQRSSFSSGKKVSRQRGKQAKPSKAHQAHIKKIVYIYTIFLSDSFCFVFFFFTFLFSLLISDIFYFRSVFNFFSVSLLKFFLSIFFFPLAPF